MPFVSLPSTAPERKIDAMPRAAKLRGTAFGHCEGLREPRLLECGGFTPLWMFDAAFRNAPPLIQSDVQPPHSKGAWRASRRKPDVPVSLRLPMFARNNLSTSGLPTPPTSQGSGTWLERRRRRKPPAPSQKKLCKDDQFRSFSQPERRPCFLLAKAKLRIGEVL